MAGMAIYWNGRTLQLDAPSVWDARRAVRKDVHRSDSGRSETAIRERYDRLVFGLDLFDSSAWYDELRRWWTWAAEGRPFAVAFDSADVVYATLSGSASAGATSLTVTSGTGIVAGRRYRIRDADGRYEEIVTVGGGYVSGTTVPITSGLVWAHGAGAFFSSLDYYPALETEDDVFPVQELPGLVWTLQVSAREYRS